MENTNMNNNIYKNAKIYKIVDLAYTEQYIGSIVQGLSSRMTTHRQKYKEYLISKQNSNSKPYFYSSFILFNTYGIENCKIELVEEYPCASKEQLRRREGYHIQLASCVNKNVAGRTIQEYRVAHVENKKQWYVQNKDRLKVIQKVYNEENSDRITEYKKQWYEQNKLRIAERRNSKHCCTLCGGKFTYTSRTVHEKTRKHQKALNQEPEPET